MFSTAEVFDEGAFGVITGELKMGTVDDSSPPFELVVGVKELVRVVFVGSVLNEWVNSLKLLVYGRVCRFKEGPDSRVVDHI